MIRHGTCITDEAVVIRHGDNTWISRCGCGKDWPLGKTRDICVECVRGRCNHPKHGVEQEQGRLM